MAIKDTIRLRVEFTDFDDVTPIAVENVTLNIYDRNRVVIETVESADIGESATGAYFYDWVAIDEYSGPLVFEFAGVYNGNDIVKRAYIDRQWVEYEIKGLLLNWAKDHCRDDFVDKDGIERIPAGIEMFVEEGAKYYAKVATDILNGSVASESLGDYSVTLTNVVQHAISSGMPAHLRVWLEDYRRWVIR